MSLHPLFRCTLAALAFLASSGLAYAQFNARVQAIHNAADPSLEVIDLYVSGQLVLNDVAFRTASPYLDIPALIPLTGGIAPGNSTGPGDVFFEFGFTLALNQTYQFILLGVRNPGLFLPNPDGRDISLDVLVKEDAREVGSDPGSIDVNVIHGITDTPMSDVEWTVILADDIAYGESTDYVTFIPDGAFILVDPRPATVIAYNPPPFDPGDVITLLLSGFQDSVGNQNGPFFSVLAVFPDGQSIELVPFPVSTEPDESLPDTFSLRGNYPNPFNPSTTISFDLASPARVSIEVFDVFGRNILTTPRASFSAGAGHEFQLDASSLSSGTYLYRVLAELRGGVQIQTGRMTLVR